MELFWAGSPSTGGPEHCALFSEISVFVRFSLIVHSKELLLSCCIEPNQSQSCMAHGKPSTKRWRQSLASIIFVKVRFRSSLCLWESNPLTCSLKVLGLLAWAGFDFMTHNLKVIDPQGLTSQGTQWSFGGPTFDGVPLDKLNLGAPNTGSFSYTVHTFASISWCFHDLFVVWS